MARLNDPPMFAAESLDAETHRKRLVRQNRDLAKSNNIRALRIRELETECACMLSENLTLQTRILELERQLEDNGARRIADHALEIKEKLEARLAEWGALVSGLGIEPPSKRRLASPMADRRMTKNQTGRRSSFVRPSPSQRRLRDVAREVEELGHITENRSYSRMSMDSDQILALRSEAEDDEGIESPELGPPPMSRFVEEELASRAHPPRLPSPKIFGRLPPASPTPLRSPIAPRAGIDHGVVPESRNAPTPRRQQTFDARSAHSSPARSSVPCPAKTPPPPAFTTVVDQPARTSAKRKFGSVDDNVESVPAEAQQPSNRSRSRGRGKARAGDGASKARDRTTGKSLKESVSVGKARERPATPDTFAPLIAAVSAVPAAAPAAEIAAPAQRKPLAAKSTNEDVGSPAKKAKGSPMDEVAAAKREAPKEKKGPRQQQRPRPGPRDGMPVLDAGVPEPPAPAPVSPEPIEPELEPEPQPEPESRSQPQTESRFESGSQFPAKPRPGPKPESRSHPVSALPLPAPIPEQASSPCPPTPSMPQAPLVAPDTPPPADISSTGETSRPSRRARATVSYAEPNLRDKMRRPTKELVDAVSCGGKTPRIGLNFTPTSAPAAAAESAMPPPSLPRPLRDAAESSEGLPAPDGTKMTEASASSTITHRKKRTSSMAAGENAAAATPHLEHKGRSQDKPPREEMPPPEVRDPTGPPEAEGHPPPTKSNPSRRTSAPSTRNGQEPARPRATRKRPSVAANSRSSPEPPTGGDEAQGSSFVRRKSMMV